MNILVTGGAGYIGSHTLVELIAAGHTVTVVDTLTNSSQEVMRRLEKITGTSIPFHSFSALDKTRLTELFDANSFDAVLHFAGLKAVGESVAEPLKYYRVNLDAAITVLEVMKEHNVHRFILSSSATVYGSAPIPYSEESETGHGITNPYGRTKYMIEEILRDTAAADPKNIFVSLRFFNPIGAHESGLIGEYPQGTPNNIMPYIAQVATGERSELTIFGNDYPTVDGTGVRDYIHVVDLARGHVAALAYNKPGMTAVNLGTGHGTSVLQLVHAFEKASGKTIPYKIAARRAGDLPEYYAKADRAKRLFNWEAQKSIEEACADTWRWQSQNPHGYQS